jgi:protein-disulfide isomerase
VLQLSALVGVLAVVAACATRIDGNAEPAGGPASISAITDPTITTPSSAASFIIPTAPETTPPSDSSSSSESSSSASSSSSSSARSSSSSSRSSSSRSSSSSSQSGDPDVPQSLTTENSTGTIVVGSARAKVVIDLLAEPICPPCATFESVYGADLGTAIAAGKVQLRLHLMTFLDDKSASTDYSTRAASMLACGAAAAFPDQAPAFLDFYNRVFDPKRQPKEGGTSDLSNTQIQALAAPSKFPDLTTCADSTEAAQFVSSSETEGERLITASGASGTPAVVVNDRLIDSSDTNWLDKLLG